MSDNMLHLTLNTLHQQETGDYKAHLSAHLLTLHLPLSFTLQQTAAVFKCKVQVYVEMEITEDQCVRQLHLGVGRVSATARV